MNKDDIKFMQEMNGSFYGGQKHKDLNDEDFTITFKVKKDDHGEAKIEDYKSENIDIKIPMFKNADGTRKIAPNIKDHLFPNIVHIDYWKCFVPPNRFSVYYSDHTHIDITHDESELCQNLINCIEKHGGLRGDYDEMYADVFWLLLGLERINTDSTMINAVQFAIGKH